MKCKHCQNELEKGVTLCPVCGKENPEAAQSGLGAGKIALLVILAVAAIAVIAALVMGGGNGAAPVETTAPAPTGESAPAVSVPNETVPSETVPMTVPADGNPKDVTCKGSYTAEAEALTAAASTVVATMGDVQLTNAELQIYYWMGVYDFLNQYAMYAQSFGLDYTKPMDMQLSIDGKLTWQQYFLDNALKMWTNYQSMASEAKANGYVLDEEYQIYLEELPGNMAESAAEMGYESVEAMIQGDMGPGASMDSYMKYLDTYYMGYMYYGDSLEQMTVTDAEVEAYFDAHAEEYKANDLEKTDERWVDVRHILIQPESADGSGTFTDADWAAAEKKANEVLNEWLTKHPDEDGFSVLAQVYSTDPGSAANGGLYEDVKQGDMVPEFDAWCFDVTRKAGDYGIVKTTYGYHIMYFVGSAPGWYLTAEEDMMVEKGNEFLAQILEKYPAQIDYSAIVIGNANLTAAQ